MIRPAPGRPGAVYASAEMVDQVRIVVGFLEEGDAVGQTCGFARPLAGRDDDLDLRPAPVNDYFD